MIAGALYGICEHLQVAAVGRRLACAFWSRSVRSALKVKDRLGLALRDRIMGCDLPCYRVNNSRDSSVVSTATGHDF